MLYAGRLMPLKGVSLAIRALESLPGWRLIDVLSGVQPDAARLRAIGGGPWPRGARRFPRLDRARTAVLRTMPKRLRCSFFRASMTRLAGSSSRQWRRACPWSASTSAVHRFSAGHGSAVTPAGQRGTAERIAQRVLEVAEADPEAIRERARSFLIERRSRRSAQLLAGIDLPSRER